MATNLQQFLNELFNTDFLQQQFGQRSDIPLTNDEIPESIRKDTDRDTDPLDQHGRTKA